jgi:hypothetical protein
MGRRKAAEAAETPQEARQRLVAELRLFGHKESADLLEADGWGLMCLGWIAEELTITRQGKEG